MTEKQLGNSVLHGRMITFAQVNADPITGYLAGLDDDYFLVLVPDSDGVLHYLLKRDVIPWKEIHVKSTLREEAYREALESILEPFRKWVRETLLGIEAPKKS
jgi:hypothetical protein